MADVFLTLAKQLTESNSHIYKNSSGDEIVNVNFFTTSHM